MGKKRASEKVVIRPGVSILAVLSRLNYKPWYALAEFVDNSLQSFLDSRREIRRFDSRKPRLRIDIRISAVDGGRITIRDNAGGIRVSEFPRAFRPAEVPADTSGLHEYGMGMKSAACWFAKNWTVWTSAVGDPYARRVKFDIKKIVQDKIEELDVEVEDMSRAAHFTEIVLTNLHRIPQGRSLGKIKEHLASIYRRYLEDGTLELFVDNEALVFKPPSVLKAPYYKALKSKPIVWRAKIDISFGGRKRVSGFAALRETGGFTEGGFALFRKNRLIQGSADEGYKPKEIFGNPNSYTSLRLFGELDIEGFDVSHTKDGFVWQDQEDEIVSRLLSALETKRAPLLSQAEGHRQRPAKAKFEKIAPKLLKEVAKEFEGHAVLKTLDKQRAAPTEAALPKKLPRGTKEQSATQRIELEFRDEKWIVEVDLVNDPVVRDFVEVSDLKGSRQTPRRIGIRMTTAHPFVQRYVGADLASLEPLVRVAIALVLAETAARDGGVKNASTVRTYFNEILRRSFK